MLRYATAIAVALVMSGSHAAQIDYYLWIDSDGPNTWSLSVSVTGAPLGLATFAVNLDNATAGNNVAPRWVLSGSPISGFANGIGLDLPEFNSFTPVGGQRQAAGSQDSSVLYPDDYEIEDLAGTRIDETGSTIVYGVGASPLENNLFGSGSGSMVGSAETDVIPFVPGLQVELFQGSYNAGSPVRFSVDPGGLTPSQYAEHATFPVTGAELNAQTLQPLTGGSVYFPDPDGYTGPTGEYTEVPTLGYHVVPEPSALVFASIAIPVLTYTIFRRRIA